MLKKILCYCLLILLGLTLAACKLLPNKVDDQETLPSKNWEQHQHALQQLAHYQAKGSFAIITPEKRMSAKFFWQQFNPDWYRLLLTTPFGGKIVELNVQNNTAQLTDDKNQLFISHDAEELVQRLTNMNIPLNSLRSTLIGLPGSAIKLKFNRYNLLQSSTVIQGQSVWQINYNSYYTNRDLPLPKLIELTHGEQILKLNITNWTLE